MIRLTALSLAAAATALLSGCVTTPLQSTVQEVRTQQNPTERATRTITNFTPALRCMDDWMFEHGTRDVTLMMEELRDATQKVPVSARDMMTSAISEMTRRSRAVRLSVFGTDQQNLQQVLQQAQKTTPFALLPEYNVRGTISQLDEDVKRDSSLLGLLTSQAFGLKLGSETRFSVLGFDAAVVQTESMTLVPGVSSKNTTVLARRDASAGDGQARILNTATVFSFSAARSEGNAQAARNMVELAAVELVGKLIRAPYWQCLGTADSHPEVQREIADWFFSMDETELTAFLKERLRERRYFDGAIDGTVTPAFTTALQAYRLALGLRAEGPMDLATFQQFITRPVAAGPLARRARLPLAGRTGSAAASAGAAVGTSVATAPASTAADVAGASSGAAATSTPAAEATANPPATTSAAPSAEPPPTMAVNLSPQPWQASWRLSIASDRAGYVYCYAQDPATQVLRRIFPNRLQRDPRIEAGRAISVGSARLVLPSAQRYACLHAPQEVYADLPAALRWGDLEPLKLPSFDAIRQVFAQVVGQNPTLVVATELPAPSATPLRR